MSTKRGKGHLQGWPGARSRQIKVKSVRPTNKPTNDRPMLTVTSKPWRRWFQRKDG